MSTLTNVRVDPKFSWFIPIDGDGAHIGTVSAERLPTFEYLSDVVRTAEAEGFYSLLIPTRFSNGLFEQNAPLAETWTMATALAAITKKIRFLIALRPGFISPGLFAQMAATLDRISNGRIDINIVPGGIQGDFERLGEHSDHSHRYTRAEEFIEVCQKLWASPDPVIYKGNHIQLNGAICSPGPIGDGPRIYMGGASEAALGLAGRKSDVYLAWITPKDKMAAFFNMARQQFAKAKRAPSFGLRTHIIVRSKESQAWEAAEELLSNASTIVKEQRQAVFAGSAMVGQKAQSQIVADHRIGPHLWNGISTVRVNCGTAIVGNPQQVAEELFGYWELGIDQFILSGFPHLEECKRVSSEVIPIVKSLITSSGH